MHLVEKEVSVREQGEGSVEEAMLTISLVLPAWNEAEVIATAVAEADAALSHVSADYEIIVVDDGSSDNTASIVRDAAATNDRVRLVRHCPNRGYGAAIRSGFAAAEKELVVFTDADCQFDLTELDRFVLLSKRYDIVCGYRIDRKDTPLRCLYSNVYNLLVRVLLGTGVRDVDCAMKMFHRDVAKKLSISGNGFLVNSEMLVQARQQGCSVVEVGVSHRPRTLGESTVSVKHIPRVLASLARYWWNEVQFPVPKNPRDGSPRLSLEDRSEAKASRRMQWGLLLIAAVFIFANLGYPLIDRDETRYAEIPREMIATGNWVLPQLNFQTYYDKPPLLYWLCAISYNLFGASAWSARLVPALAALATLASTMFFGSRIFGRRIGLLAGTVLMLSAGFAFTSRYLLIDGVLSLFVSLSLFTAYEAMQGDKIKRAWWIASGVCVGLAFLTKGPIAIVLWLPPVLAFAWLSETRAKPRWWDYGIASAVAAVIAFPWFAAVHHQDPTFLVEFFYKHNVARFGGEFHPKPIWYFVPVLLLAGHPWSFLTVPYAKYLFGRNETTRVRRTPAIGFMLLWSVWCFAFFSVSKCKLPTYLLPAAPAFALMFGHYLHEVLRDAENSSQHFFARFWSARTATATTCLAGISFVLFIMVSTSTLTPMLFGWAMLWATLLTASLLLMADRHQAKIAWGTSTGVMFLFALMVMHQVVPDYSRSQTLFGQSSPLVDQIDFNDQMPIATVGHEFSGVPFYLGRSDIPNFSSIDDGGLTGFVSQSGTSTLVVSDQIPPESVLERLPKGAKLTVVGNRGPARIYQAITSPGSTRITKFPNDVAKGTQR